MDFFIPIIIVFVIFMLCSLCGLCCRSKRNDGFVFSSPVVITSQSHQAQSNPPYPVSVQSTHGITSMPAPSSYPAYPPPTNHSQSNFGAYPMPQPMPAAGGYQPMPQPYGGMPYPPSQAIPPYPPTIPPTGTLPPSYDQVVSGEVYQKQSPYNPNYSGN